MGRSIYKPLRRLGVLVDVVTVPGVSQVSSCAFGDPIWTDCSLPLLVRISTTAPSRTRAQSSLPTSASVERELLTSVDEPSRGRLLLSRTGSMSIKGNIPTSRKHRQTKERRGGRLLRVDALNKVSVASINYPRTDGHCPYTGALARGLAAAGYSVTCHVAHPTTQNGKFVQVTDNGRAPSGRKVCGYFAGFILWRDRRAAYGGCCPNYHSASAWCSHAGEVQMP